MIFQSINGKISENYKDPFNYSGTNSVAYVFVITLHFQIAAKSIHQTIPGPRLQKEHF